MRHRHGLRKLNRTSSHRLAMLRNMTVSLLKHEVIQTTLPKAKELRRVVEPMITHGKQATLANRRLAFNRLRDRGIVTKLFSELGPGYADQDRPVVVDVGTGRPRDDEVFDPREKPVRIIVGEQFPGVEPETGAAHERVGQEYCTSIVFRAVDAGGVAGNRIDVRGARKLNSKRQ